MAGRGRLAALSALSGRAKMALAGGITLFVVVTFAACTGCGKRPRSPADGGGPASGARSSGSAAPAGSDAGPAVDDALAWENAREGDVEDLVALAVQEGAAGLVEAAGDRDRKKTALRAMAFARGWAQLPYLAKTAGERDDEDARLALEAITELGNRPRRSEDPEDAEELKEGCEALASLVRDVSRPRGRRVLALRGIRLVPCPAGKELPGDLDAK